MTEAGKREDGYLPISEYAVIGNLRTVVLVGTDGSIDWCCMPELDCPSVFGALLDAGSGGCFRIAPRGLRASSQGYLGDTCVLETILEGDGGRLSVVDFMPLRGTIIGADDPDTEPEIHRILTCVEGAVDVEVEWAPRFDYGRGKVEIQPIGAGFVASSDASELVLRGLPAGARIEEDGSGPVLRAAFRLEEGKKIAVVMRYAAAGVSQAMKKGREAPYDTAASVARLTETLRVWTEWIHDQEEIPTEEWAGEWADLVTRSELTLKLLTHPDSGAVAAAATTSLPEVIGGWRNWDYRYCWVRDAMFVVQALYALGHSDAGYDFLHFIGRAVQSGKTDGYGLQIMYGLDGETDLTESTLDHLSGYMGSRPVRIGNAAASQKQHDTFGELLQGAYELVLRREEIQPDVWDVLSSLADKACDAWRKPDQGIWEFRGPPRHYVYSKVMVWVALDRAIAMAVKRRLRGNVERWRQVRSIIHDLVLRKGYDPELGSFVQSFGSKQLDASNLLIPVVNFLPASDPRVQGTIDRTIEHLMEDGLVRRYLLPEDEEPEGAFGLCTFWLVDALALSGRLSEAREIFDGMLNRANHVGLFAEQIDTRDGKFLGNFPQAFTHLGLVNSALYLARAQGRSVPFVPTIDDTAREGSR